MRQRCLFFILFLFASIVGTGHAPLWARANAPTTATASDDTPVVTVTPPPAYRAKKIILFPLELPMYALRAVTWPLGATTDYLDKSGVMDKVLDVFTNKERTFWYYPVIEGGAGTGFGGGPVVAHRDLFHKGYTLDATYRIHINLDQMASASFGQPRAFDLWGRPVSTSYYVRWMRLIDDDFYGVGDNSLESNHSVFSYNTTTLGGRLTHHLTPHISTGAELNYIIATTGPTTSGALPSVDTTFPPHTLTGFSEWLDYASLATFAAHDTRDNPYLAETGGIQTGRLSYFVNFHHGNHRFFQLDLDARHFFPLGPPRVVLALHAGATFQFTTGDNAIPFYRLATLDTMSPLRGFDRNRFMDRNLVVANAEYRFPIWQTMDGVFFFDTGRVFHSMQNFRLNAFKYSAGGGIRFRAFKFVLFRLDAAYGGEGVNMIFGVSRTL